MRRWNGLARIQSEFYRCVAECKDAMTEIKSNPWNGSHRLSPKEKRASGQRWAKFVVGLNPTAPTNLAPMSALGINPILT